MCTWHTVSLCFAFSVGFSLLYFASIRFFARFPPFHFSPVRFAYFWENLSEKRQAAQLRLLKASIFVPFLFFFPFCFLGIYPRNCVSKLNASRLYKEPYGRKPMFSIESFKSKKAFRRDTLSIVSIVRALCLTFRIFVVFLFWFLFVLSCYRKTSQHDLWILIWRAKKGKLSL